jgi:hypothetical protein
MISAVTTTAAVYADETNDCILLGMCSGGNVALGAATLLSRDFPQIKTRVIALSTLPFQPARTKAFDQKRRWKNIKQYAKKALSPYTWLRLIRGEINVDRVKKKYDNLRKIHAEWPRGIVPKCEGQQSRY